MAPKLQGLEPEVGLGQMEEGGLLNANLGMASKEMGNGF